jgi:hypothetical protein
LNEGGGDLCCRRRRRRHADHQHEERCRRAASKGSRAISRSHNHLPRNDRCYKPLTRPRERAALPAALQSCVEGVYHDRTRAIVTIRNGIGAHAGGSCQVAHEPCSRVRTDLSAASRSVLDTEPERLPAIRQWQMPGGNGSSLTCPSKHLDRVRAP